MMHRQEIDAIIQKVTPWPKEERVALAYEILRDTRKQARAPAPRRTLERAAGIAAGISTPPDDATVRQWVDELRQKKHA